MTDTPTPDPRIDDDGVPWGNPEQCKLSRNVIDLPPVVCSLTGRACNRNFVCLPYYRQLATLQAELKAAQEREAKLQGAVDVLLKSLERMVRVFGTFDHATAAIAKAKAASGHTGGK